MKNLIREVLDQPTVFGVSATLGNITLGGMAQAVGILCGLTTIVYNLARLHELRRARLKEEK